MAITIVSGLPRSGTSMMMQMLAAGGLPVLCDEERKADSFNPRGYLEWEPVKRLAVDPRVIAQAEGAAVKIFSPFLFWLPSDFNYQVIFMERPIAEILESQNKMMLESAPRPDAAFLGIGALREAFERHLAATFARLNKQLNFRLLRVAYHRAIEQPKIVSAEIEAFLDTTLDLDSMAKQADASLYRTRMEEAA
jgi:hypothetical protein